MIERATIVNIVLVVLMATVAGLFMPSAAPLIVLAGGSAVVGMVVRDCVRALRRRRLPAPSYVDLALFRHPADSSRPADLVRLERLVGWRVFSATEFDHMLRARLARLIEYRLLASGRSLDLRRSPEEARSLLSVDLRSLIDPAAHSGADDRIDSRRLAAFIDEIERL